jgi:putative hydrolase
MSATLNQQIARRLEEVAAILLEQGANRFRVQAYLHAAETVRALTDPVSELFAREGQAGLEKLPGIGPSIARAIRDLLLHGKLAMLERMRGAAGPLRLLGSVPGIGPVLAGKIHDELGIETLEELETAAYDGRLETVLGVGAKRLSGIRDSLGQRLNRVRAMTPDGHTAGEPTVAELLDVDAEYRREAAAGRLQKIAPRRFNPAREAWLPILHTTRGEHHYTALFSNTAHAHEQQKTGDWVLLYCDGPHRDWRWTVITSEFGHLRGMRIVRGREEECGEHYRSRGKVPPEQIHPRSIFPVD